MAAKVAAPHPVGIDANLEEREVIKQVEQEMQQEEMAEKVEKNKSLIAKRNNSPINSRSEQQQVSCWFTRTGLIVKMESMKRKRKRESFLRDLKSPSKSKLVEGAEKQMLTVGETNF